VLGNLADGVGVLFSSFRREFLWQISPAEWCWGGKLKAVSNGAFSQHRPDAIRGQYPAQIR
jgi:hypothetical protein